jgi:hypothetical protein
VSPTIAHAKIHTKTGGTEKSFQSTDLPPLGPLEEGNYYNMEEGEGETSELAKENPSPPPDPKSPMKGEGIPEIRDRVSAIKSPRGSSNQSKEHLGQEIPKYYWHIFDQMAQPNQQ